jgi:hypothetical protein
MKHQVRARAASVAVLGGVVGLTVAALSVDGCFVQNGHRRRASASAHDEQGGSAATGGGGAGGQGGSTGGGGAGGNGTPCLSSAEHSQLFEVRIAGLCLVGKYDMAAEVGFFTSPTWGRHLGPMTAAYLAETDQAVITRWQVPAAETGSLVAQNSPVALSTSADTVFFGAQARDLPFLNWTMLSWTGNFGTTDGEAIFVNGQSVEARHNVSGLFAAIGTFSSDTNRLLHTSLSPFDDVSGGAAAALYAADFCPGPAMCDALEVAAWGEANGPLALDNNGNLFVMQTAYSTGSETLRGFEASTVLPGSPAVGGSELLTTAGYGSELAAMSPGVDHPGFVYYQPFDSSSYEAKDVMVQPYLVQGTAITALSAPLKALEMVTANTPVTLMTDHLGRLWVGIAAPGTGTSTFYVLQWPVFQPL